MEKKTWFLSFLPNSGSEADVKRRTESEELARLDLAPYAGCWVAVVEGRVVGVGRTPRAARAAAKRSRPKDDPLVVKVSRDGRLTVDKRAN